MVRTIQPLIAEQMNPDVGHGTSEGFEIPRLNLSLYDDASKGCDPRSYVWTIVSPQGRGRVELS